MDVFKHDYTRMYTMLNGSLDKTHSASFHLSTEIGYQDSVFKENPIAWPTMKESEKWQQLDDAVGAFWLELQFSRGQNQKPSLCILWPCSIS